MVFPNYKINPDALKYFEIAYNHRMQGGLEQAVIYYKIEASGAYER